MRLLLIISLIVGIILQVYYFTALSDKVAINFGLGGNPIVGRPKNGIWGLRLQYTLSIP